MALYCFISGVSVVVFASAIKTKIKNREGEKSGKHFFVIAIMKSGKRIFLRYFCQKEEDKVSI
jgi:hypothetical protein